MDKDNVIAFPGISIVWGLVVMVMLYSVGHISGAHFNPTIAIAFATCRRFPWKQVVAIFTDFRYRYELSYLVEYFLNFDACLICLRTLIKKQL